MRFVLLFILLLFPVRCVTWKCQGTCRGMNQMASGMGAACTKSPNCLILTCDTPYRAAQYGAVIKPRIQIYPCTDPPTVNLQIHGNFLGRSINENRNFTKDSTFQETMEFFGRSYTVIMHVTLRQLTGKIRFGLTATYGSKSYTLIPNTDIPIDRSRCPGMRHTRHNPLCIVATPTQLVTTGTKETHRSTLPTTESNSVASQTGTETKSMVTTSESMVSSGTTESMVNSGTTESMVNSGTTESMVNLGTTESMVNWGTTESMVSSGTTESMVNSGTTESMVNSGTTESMVTARGRTIATSNQIGTNTENSTLIISQQQQMAVTGVVSGSVVVVVVAIAVILIISALVIIYFITQRRRIVLSNLRYSNIKDSLREL